MTNRDFYNAVANLDNAPEDIKSYAENAIKALNDKNSARNAKVKEKKSAENAPYIDGILNILADGNPHTCGEIAKALDTNTSKISYLVGKMDNVTKSTVKVDKKKAVAYTLAN